MANRVRNKKITFFFDEEEYAVVQKKMEKLGITNLSHYLRKMALEGMIVQIDFSNLNEMSAELNRISRNINQIAKRVNATDTAYIEDLRQIRKGEEEIWQLLKSILSKLHSERL